MQHKIKKKEKTLEYLDKLKTTLAKEKKDFEKKLKGYEMNRISEEQKVDQQSKEINSSVISFGTKKSKFN